MTCAVPHRGDAAHDGAARRDARVGARDGRRRHGHDLAGRGVSVVAQARHGGALVDRRLGAHGARDEAADDRLGDHRASTRHPVQAAMDARVVQEAAGPGRFILGFGTSKIFLNNTKTQTKKTLGPMRDAVDDRARRALAASAFDYDGDTWSADVPALAADAHSPREVPPVYVAATAPKMQALAGEIADGCLTPSITTPAFVRYTRENVGADIDIGCTVVASIHATDRDAGRDGAREIAGMYLANKVQNIQGAADTLLDLAGLEQDEIRPVAEAMEQGGRLAAKAQVTDAILDKCKPIAGTPADCIAAIEEYKDAGCTHVMLELWGEDRLEQIRLFGEQVLPHVRMIAGRDRPRPARRDGELADRHPQLHRRRAGDGSAHGRAVRGARTAGAVAAGRGRPRERARDVARAGRRQDADVQRPHGHVVLGPRAVAARRARLPAAGVRARRPPLRARHLEHERRARVLRRGGARAAGCGRPAARRRADRRRVRRDREDAVRRRARRASTAATQPERRYLVSHGGVADMCLLGEPTEGKVVLGHFGALWLRIRVHGNFIHTAFSEGKRDQNSILRMHEVTSAVLEWIPTWEDDPSERVPRREGDRERRRHRGRLRLARLAHAAPHRPVPRRPRAADEADGRRAPRGARDGARARRALPRLRRSRARST